jgi:hypothetical protein
VCPADSRYHEQVRAEAIDIPTDVGVRVELITLPGSTARVEAGVPLDAALGPVEIDQITPFVVVHAMVTGPDGEELRQSTVVRCRLLDDPDGRLDEVLARQVDSGEKFLRYLLLVLGITDPGLPGAEATGRDGAAGSWVRGSPGAGIFELLARAIAERPDVLDGLERLVPRLRATAAGASVLPPGFDALWDVIVAARPRIAELSGEGHRR